jgi:hypothetical protein
MAVWVRESAFSTRPVIAGSGEADFRGSRGVAPRSGAPHGPLEDSLCPHPRMDGFPHARYRGHREMLSRTGANRSWGAGEKRWSRLHSPHHGSTIAPLSAT